MERQGSRRFMLEVISVKTWLLHSSVTVTDSLCISVIDLLAIKIMMWGFMSSDGRLPY